MKEPKPQPIPKTHERTPASGQKTAPDTTYNKKPLRPS